MNGSIEKRGSHRIPHAGKRAGLGRPRPIGYSRRKPSASAFSAEIIIRRVPVCPMILPPSPPKLVLEFDLVCN